MPTLRKERRMCVCSATRRTRTRVPRRPVHSTSLILANHKLMWPTLSCERVSSLTQLVATAPSK